MRNGHHYQGHRLEYPVTAGHREFDFARAGVLLVMFCRARIKAKLPYGLPVFGGYMLKEALEEIVGEHSDIKKRVD